ncbi:uncharacterized protein [Paramisgurnus dabryanus]|uniref:uncharacterized protein n=1 Tax=Paramisgurnus dabryanus TaxID=90735 RepID=UPI0031F4252B
MRHVLILLLGVHLSYATRHSLQYFGTGVSGDSNIAEYTEVGLLDGCEFMYFDSNIKKAVPKTEWIKRNGADYWDRVTQILIGNHQVSRNNIQVVKERFNQTGGVHTIQFLYGCELDDETGATDGFMQHGYDGEDFLSLDLKELRWISPIQQGVITTQKWNNNRALLENNKQYFTTECVDWMKKYLQYEKDIHEKLVSPEVSLIQKDSSSPLICHATGFYPCKVTITWLKNDQEHDEDVDLGELVPNEDGTYQKSSTLKVKPDELNNNKFRCVVEHQGKKVTKDKIRTNNGDSVGIIVGVVAAVVLLLVAGIAGLKFYQKKKGFKPVNTSDGGSNSSSSQIGPCDLTTTSEPQFPCVQLQPGALTEGPIRCLSVTRHTPLTQRSRLPIGTSKLPAQLQYVRSKTRRLTLSHHHLPRYKQRKRRRMRILLVLGFVFVIKESDAAMHTLQYFFTATSGITNFPEFVSLGMVDGQQVDYYDSKIKRTIPKTQWVSAAVEPEYWDQQTQKCVGMEQKYKNNIDIVKNRFNLSGGVHTSQVIYGCEWNDETGDTNGFHQEGYDGEDFLSLDLKYLRWISPQQQGFITQQKWNNNRALIENKRQYLSAICIEWLKKYLEYGKSNLEKTVSPQVFLLQKDLSSPVMCHATGFYPSGIKISWEKHGQEHEEDVELGETLPNEDGTYQRKSTLKVTPEDLKKIQYNCVVEHKGKTIRMSLQEDEIRTNNGKRNSVPVGIVCGVAAAAAAALLFIIGVIGFKVYQKKKSASDCSNDFITKSQKPLNSKPDPENDSKAESNSDIGSDVCSNSGSDCSSVDSTKCLIRERN